MTASHVALSVEYSILTLGMVPEVPAVCDQPIFVPEPCCSEKQFVEVQVGRFAVNFPWIRALVVVALLMALASRLYSTRNLTVWEGRLGTLAHVHFIPATFHAALQRGPVSGHFPAPVAGVHAAPQLASVE